MIVPDYIERSNRKTLSLTVLKDGVVLVKAPLTTPDETINKFVTEKQAWIQSKLALINQTNSRFEDIIKYRKILLYGNKYSICVGDVKKIETTDSFQVVLPRKTEPDKVLKILKSWYKKVAKKILSDRLAFIESKVRMQSKAMRICDSKGKWGSCNSAKTISFNWRVIMLPPNIIDYVIVHELCHLLEMNHSRKFWDLVARILPDVAKRKKAIKEYGFLLSLFNKV